MLRLPVRESAGAVGGKREAGTGTADRKQGIRPSCQIPRGLFFNAPRPVVGELARTISTAGSAEQLPLLSPLRGSSLLNN